MLPNNTKGRNRGEKYLEDNDIVQDISKLDVCSGEVIIIILKSRTKNS